MQLDIPGGKSKTLQLDIPISAGEGSIIPDPIPDPTPDPTPTAIPEWIKNNAGWWANGDIDDNSFVQGIQFLIKEGIMKLES